MTWQKGQSGNPEGPQSRKPWRDALRKVGAQHAPGKRSGPKRLETVATQCFSEADGGNMAASKEIVDRLGGRDMTGPGLDGAVTVPAVVVSTLMSTLTPRNFWVIIPAGIGSTIIFPRVSLVTSRSSVDTISTNEPSKSASASSNTET